MAHGTSRMAEPGPGDISPSPAPSGRDPVVQSVWCCFRLARSAAQCLAALVSGGSRGGTLRITPVPIGHNLDRHHRPPYAPCGVGLACRGPWLSGPPCHSLSAASDHSPVRPAGTAVAGSGADPVAGDNGIGVVIQILRRSRRYESDHEQLLIRLGPALPANRWPHVYSAIPGTVAGDGGPLDTLVLALDTLMLARDTAVSGWHLVARLTAVLWMAGQKGLDVTVACVPARSPGWHAVVALRQVPRGLLSEIRRFPGICKDLQSGRGTSVRAYEGRGAASAELTASRERLRVRAEVLIDAGATA